MAATSVWSVQGKEGSRTTLSLSLLPSTRWKSSREAEKCEAVSETATLRLASTASPSPLSGGTPEHWAQAGFAGPTAQRGVGAATAPQSRQEMP